MDNDERITGRVRTLTEAGIGNLSKDELLLRLARVLEALQQKDEALQQKDKALQQKDKALQQKDKALQQSARNTIFDDAVKGNWNFDQLMDTINRLEFPKVEFSEGLFDPQPRASSVATPKSVGAEFHLDTSEFKYQMLAYPGRCGWKRVSLPGSMHDFVCTTLFGGNAAAFDNTLATYGAYLGQLRDVYGYRRLNSGKVDENDHFRPTFTLWLGHLLNSISSFWEVKVKDRGIGTLSFAAHLKLKGNPTKTKVKVRGHEDVVILHNGHVKILGEYKAPFSAMWPSEDAQALLHAALSQMYAEMQGFIGTHRHTSTPSVMTETAAAIATESSEGSIGGDKIWYVSFLTDGFALRVSLASEPSAVDDEGLPTVYTSSITSFLDPGSFTETILYMLAVAITNNPLIDVVASSDFNEDLLHSTLPANDGPGGDGPNGPGAGGSFHRSPSDPIRSPHHAVDEGGDDDCGLCNMDRFVVNWNGYDEYLQFLEAEEEEVDRLNSLLASSFAKEGRLSKYALKTLGTKSLVF